MYCPNPKCEGHKDRLSTAKFKWKKRGVYYCKLCMTTWSSSLGTFLYNMKTPVPVILKSIYKVTKGKSLRQVAAEERVSIDSIYYWLERARKFPHDISKLSMQYLNLSSLESQKLLSCLGENLRKRSKKVS